MKHNLLERHKVLENTLPTETLSDCIKEAKRRQNKRRLLDPHPQIVHARSKQKNITVLQAHASTDEKGRMIQRAKLQDQREKPWAWRAGQSIRPQRLTLGLET